MSKETLSVSATGGGKGVKKQRYDLIPVGPLARLAELYGFGEQKYPGSGWRKGFELSKSYAAMLRHQNLFWGGEDIDQETGLPHLTAVAWHAFTMLEFVSRIEEFPEFDDRFKQDSPLGFDSAPTVKETSDTEFGPALEAFLADNAGTVTAESVAAFAASYAAETAEADETDDAETAVEVEDNSTADAADTADTADAADAGDPEATVEPELEPVALADVIEAAVPVIAGTSSQVPPADYDDVPFPNIIPEPAEQPFLPPIPPLPDHGIIPELNGDVTRTYAPQSSPLTVSF